MYRRPGFFGIFGIIIFLSIIEIFFSMFGWLINVAFYFLPIIVGIILVISIIRAIKKQTKKRKDNKISEEKTKFSINVEKINNKLKEYFKKYEKLPVVDGIYFVNEKEYTDLEDMIIVLKGEKTIKLSEFKEKNEDGYNSLIQLLSAFADSNEEVLASDIDVNDDSQNILSNGEKYINKINALNAQIPNEEVTNSLSLTCDLLKQIEVTKNSKKDEEKLTKLYDYYLPILIDVLEKYVELLAKPVKSDDFKKTEAQLLKTTLLINEAMKNLYEMIQEDDYLNINADMDTLQSLLKKDGYAGNPFKGNNNE